MHGQFDWPLFFWFKFVFGDLSWLSSGSLDAKAISEVVCSLPENLVMKATACLSRLDTHASPRPSRLPWKLKKWEKQGSRSLPLSFPILTTYAWSAARLVITAVLFSQQLKRDDRSYFPNMPKTEPQKRWPYFAVSLKLYHKCAILRCKEKHVSIVFVSWHVPKISMILGRPKLFFFPQNLKHLLTKK